MYYMTIVLLIFCVQFPIHKYLNFHLNFLLIYNYLHSLVQLKYVRCLNSEYLLDHNHNILETIIICVRDISVMWFCT